jgi:hypothetical protein
MISESKLKTLEEKRGQAVFIIGKYAAIENKEDISKEEAEKWLYAFSQATLLLEEIITATCLDLHEQHIFQLHNNAFELFWASKGQIRRLRYKDRT